MKPLPDNVRAYKRTATFTEATLPAGLLGEHRTRADTWGVIHVLHGEVLYRLLGPLGDSSTAGVADVEEHLLRPGVPGIVEPTVPHRLELRGPVELYVEFHR